MKVLTDDLVHWIIVVKLNESKTTLLAILLIGNNASRNNIAKGTEVVAQVLLVEIIPQSSNEQLLDGGTSLWTVDVLSGNGPLRFHHTAIDFVRPLVLCFVHHVRLRVRDETEPAATLGLGVLHDDHVHYFAPLFKVGLQGFVGGTVVQSADEQFPQMFRLADFLEEVKTNSGVD